MATNADFDRLTGETLLGWPAVRQSLKELIVTSFGERTFREYYGSGIPAFLGRERLGKDMLGRLATVFAAAIDVFEPRFKVQKIVFTEITATGRITMSVAGNYLPFALEGDEKTTEAKVFELPL